MKERIAAYEMIRPAAFTFTQPRFETKPRTTLSRSLSPGFDNSTRDALFDVSAVQHATQPLHRHRQHAFEQFHFHSNGFEYQQLELPGVQRIRHPVQHDPKTDET